VEENHPKNQHYVPQFLLRNFCKADGATVCCFDKQTGRSFETNTRNVAGEKWFYDLVDGEPDLSLEGPMADLEGASAKIINDKLLKDKTVRSLSAKDRDTIALFVAIQMLRTKSIRETAKQIDSLMEKVLMEGRPEGAPIPGFTRIRTDSQAREFALGLLSQAGDLVPYILNKVWLLYESRSQFILSDNPVGLQNTVNKSDIVGTLGLGVRGIEVYLPLSVDLTICFLCKDTFIDFANYFDRYHDRLEREGRFEHRNFVNRVRRKLPVSCIPENITNINSIQVISAERFLFSNADRFDLAKEMISAEPRLRYGRRLTMN
jgi:hypothetical protein